MIRTGEGGVFLPTNGVVRPVARRVLRHMRAAGVLSTSRAAAQSRAAGVARRDEELGALRAYAVLLGEDAEAARELAESARVLQDVAAPAPGSVRAKAVTHAAMRMHRGSKDFDTG